MKTKEEFIKLVDNRFFKHLLKNSLIPFESTEKRNSFLGRVYDDLHSDLLNYKPKPPRKYVSVPKSKYVIRMVPTFELADYCIYYFCIKVLEDFIAENRVEGTYGGFRLGGKLRDKENQEFEPAFEDSYNENSFNSFAWKQEYGEYQAKVYENALKMGSEYQFAVHFDIANFYDCIRLDLLEKKIRARIENKACNDEIHLLFRFLKYWNSQFDTEKTVGIPQDEVGDCSRILSNFFLQEFDQFSHNICLEKKGLFLRYADDHVVFAQSREDAEEILYEISHKLFEEGLNINTGKIKEFTTFQDFDDCYAFTIFEKLKFEEQSINQAFELFVTKKENCAHFRESSVLKRLLHDKINLDELENRKRIKLLSFLLDEDFLLFADDHYMNQIFKMLKDKSEKEEFIKMLNIIRERTNFKSYKIQVKRFENKIKLNYVN
jgi:hypothetical protein